MTETMNTPPQRVAIYTRSAATTTNPDSLKDQERRCREAIAEQIPECTVAEDCIFQDSGASGLTSRRPGLEALLKKAAESPQPFSCLFVDSVSMIGRSWSVVLLILDTLRSHGVDVFVAEQRMYMGFPGGGSAI